MKTDRLDRGKRVKTLSNQIHTLNFKLPVTGYIQTQYNTKLGRKKKPDCDDDAKWWIEPPPLLETPLDAAFNHSGANAGSLFFLVASLFSITITDHDNIK